MSESPRPTTAVVSTRTAAMLLVLVILLWGANWPVMKVGLNYMPALKFAALRMALGAAIMFIVNAIGGTLRLPSRNDWKIVLSVGIMQMAGYLMLIITGLQFVPPGRSSILAYTTSLWVVPLAAIFLNERLPRLKLLGFCVGIAGVAVMFNPLGFEWHDPHVLIGNGLLMLGALLWAGQIVQVRGHRWEGSPLTLAPWQFLVAACVITPFALYVDHGRAIHWGTAVGLILLYNGPIATAFGFWAVLTFTRALPAVTTSLATLGVPVVGLLLSAAALGERLTATIVGGLVLILAGLTLVTLSDRARAARG